MQFNSCILRRLWIFADAPNLIKLVRINVMDPDGGLLIRNDRGGSSLLSRRPFEDILALQTGDLRVAHRLERSCVEVYEY